MDTVGTNREGVALWDWNAHYDSWHLKGESNRRGNNLHETMQLNSIGLIQQHKTPTFKRGEQRCRINVVFATEKLVTKPPTKECLSSDHTVILITIRAHTTIKSLIVEKLVTVIVKLEALLCGLEKGGRGMQEAWYTSLTGDTPFDKLKTLVAESQRVMKIN